MRIDYRCDQCGEVRWNDQMDSMQCECGGQFRPNQIPNVDGHFEPYYDRVLRTEVRSERQKERLVKKFKSNGHPDGLYNVRDDKKFMREMAYIQKHREEYKSISQPGYKPRTESEIQRQGEHAHDEKRPNRYAPPRSHFIFR